MMEEYGDHVLFAKNDPASPLISAIRAKAGREDDDYLTADERGESPAQDYESVDSDDEERRLEWREAAA